MVVILTGARRGANVRPVRNMNCTLKPRLPGPNVAMIRITARFGKEAE